MMAKTARIESRRQRRRGGTLCGQSIDLGIALPRSISSSVLGNLRHGIVQCAKEIDYLDSYWLSKNSRIARWAAAVWSVVKMWLAFASKISFAPESFSAIIFPLPAGTIRSDSP